MISIETQTHLYELDIMSNVDMTISFRSRLSTFPCLFYIQTYYLNLAVFHTSYSALVKGNYDSYSLMLRPHDFGDHIPWSNSGK